MKGLKLDPKNIKDALNQQGSNEPVATIPSVNRVRTSRSNYGNINKKMVLGKMVTFTYKIIEIGKVEQQTSVFHLNERDQELLNEHGLSDILPDIKKNKINDFEAYARPTKTGYEVADGSRRRRACILGKAALSLWVADLTDAQMEYLSETGNKHKPASVYERGLQYEHWIETGRYTSSSDIARERKIARRTVDRCRHAAKLPKWLIEAYRTPNDMSVDSAERLYVMMSKSPIDEELLKRRVNSCKIQWSNLNFSGADVTKLLLSPVDKAKKTEPRWLIKNRVQVIPTKNGLRYELPELNESQQKKMDDFVKALLKK